MHYEILIFWKNNSDILDLDWNDKTGLTIQIQNPILSLDFYFKSAYLMKLLATNCRSYQILLKYILGPLKPPYLSLSLPWCQTVELVEEEETRFRRWGSLERSTDRSLAFADILGQQLRTL